MRKRTRYQFKKAFKREIERNAIRKFKKKELKDCFPVEICNASSECLNVEPLKEGNLIFMKSENSQDAFLKTSREKKRISMPEGYCNSALNLLRMIRKSNDNLVKDSYIFPALFCLRQYLELTMKESISLFENLGGRYKDDRNHSLTDLWNSLCNFLDEKDKECQIVGQLIREFDDKDRSSTTFRYPYQKDKQGKVQQASPFNDLIDIENLEKRILQLYRFFEGVNGLADNAESEKSDSRDCDEFIEYKE